MVLRFKGGDSCDHAIECNSNRPKINFLIVAPTYKYFWSQISRCANYSQQLCFDSFVIGFLADSEVNYFKGFVLHVVKHIFRF